MFSENARTRTFINFVRVHAKRHWRHKYAYLVLVQSCTSLRTTASYQVLYFVIRASSVVRCFEISLQTQVPTNEFTQRRKNFREYQYQNHLTVISRLCYSDLHVPLLEQPKLEIYIYIYIYIDKISCYSFEKHRNSTPFRWRSINENFHYVIFKNR